MAFCGKCGTKVEEGIKFCSSCGEAIGAPAPEQEATQAPPVAEQPAANQNDFSAKGSKFARFHANQGLTLFIACVAWSIVYSILNWIILAISWRLYFISSIIGLLSLVFLLLAVIGIINAANGKAKELPVIGKFKFLK